MYFVFLFAFVLHLLTFLITMDFGFQKSLSLEALTYSTVDMLLSYFVVALIYFRFPSFFKSGETYFKYSYASFFDKHVKFLVVLVLIAAFQAIESINLILSGIARHQLLQEYDRGGLVYMLVSGIFKMLVPLVFYFGASKKVKTLALVGLLCTVMITASRSELMYVINFYIILMIFDSSKNQIMRLSLVVLSMVFLAITSTIFLQNRPISDGFYAVLDLTRSVFQYKAYAYYLSDISLEKADSIFKVLFPFFGYISEFVIKVVFGSVDPIDSEFVGHLHYLGSSPVTGRPYLANVIYPWWSWFVGSFGFFGLIIKAMYCFALLYFCAGKRMLFTTIIIASFTLFGVSGAHPLLTLTHTLSVVSCILIDFGILFFTKYKFKVFK